MLSRSALSVEQCGSHFLSEHSNLFVIWPFLSFSRLGKISVFSTFPKYRLNKQLLIILPKLSKTLLHSVLAPNLGELGTLQSVFC